MYTLPQETETSKSVGVPILLPLVEKTMDMCFADDADTDPMVIDDPVFELCDAIHLRCSFEDQGYPTGWLVEGRDLEHERLLIWWEIEDGLAGLNGHGHISLVQPLRQIQNAVEDRLNTNRERLVRETKENHEKGVQEMERSAEIFLNTPPIGEPDSKENHRLFVCETLDLPVARWIQDGRENSSYRMILDDGTDILIGSVRAVRSPTRFADAVYERIGIELPSLKPKQWTLVRGSLGKIVEVTEDEDGRVERLHEWLSSYLRTNPPRAADDAEDLFVYLLNKAPFIREGKLHLASVKLLHHVKLVMSLKASSRDVITSLRAAGFTRQTVSARGGKTAVDAVDEKKKVSAKLWIDEGKFSSVHR